MLIKLFSVEQKLQKKKDINKKQTCMLSQKYDWNDTAITAY